MTAYEMSISDWSPDVCSSDLWKWEDSRRDRRGDCSGRELRSDPAGLDFLFRTKPQSHEKAGSRPQGRFSFHRCDLAQREGKKPLRGQHDIFVPLWLCAKPIGPARSEEHTSEPQSLLRHSSAVFCFKK